MTVDDEILRATWRALCTHGYADLTMQDIADETTKSKAALHYHYDSKRDLLLSALNHVADRFYSRVQAAADSEGDGATRLRAVVDAALSPPEDETTELERLQTVLVELKTQAPHDPAIRDHLETVDERFRTLLADVLADGVADGSVRGSVDPPETAHLLVTMLAGAQLRQVSVGERQDRVRDHVRRHLRAHVYAEADATAVRTSPTDATDGGETEAGGR